MATLPSNYDLAFSGTTPYVSGPNSTTLGRTTPSGESITTEPDQFTEIAAVGGFAAGIAFDAAGNLYYGTSFRSNNKLVEFTAQQVKQAEDLRRRDGLVQPARYGSNVTVDSAGHVLFTVNMPSSSTAAIPASTLGIWNGKRRRRQLPRHRHGRRRHWYTSVRAAAT